MVWVEKLKELGVTDEEFNKFCEKYPDFKNNRELMAKLYLAVVKGVRVAEPKVTGEFQKVSELTVNVPSKIRVVIIQKVDRRVYTGCPKCYKKLEGAPNTVIECPRDGPVRAQPLEWNVVLAGDDSGEVLLAFPPSIGTAPNPGEVIAVEGVLTEWEEFLVWRYSSAEAVKPQLPPKIEVVSTAPSPTPVTVTVPTPVPSQTTAQVPVQTPTETPSVTPTVPSVAPTPSQIPSPAPVEKPSEKPTEGVKCPICGKEFKNAQAVKIHQRLIHKKRETAEKPTVKIAEVKPQETKPEAKPEAKPVEAKPEEKPQPKPEAKLEAKPQPSKFPEEALKLARVAAMIQKPYEEFKAFIAGKFPDIDVDGLIKAVGAEVRAGKVVKMP
jgi:hypothetical protein